MYIHKKFTKTHESSIDVILTNKPKSFQFSAVFETGLSDYHQMVITSLKTKLVRLKPKTITYRNYKKFNSETFLMDIQNASFICNTDDANVNYNNLVNTFHEIVNKHAPIKHKIVRGNQAPFMNRDLRKAIYNRSRLKNNLNKNPTKENSKNYKKQRNLCVTLRRKAIKSYLKTITDKGIMNNKKFWKVVKPFITNKSGLTNNDICIIDKNNIITKEEDLTNLFNEHYINIVEKSTGVKPISLFEYKEVNDIEVLSSIITKYKNHPSIIEIIKNKNCGDGKFSFCEIEQTEIKNLLLNLNANKSTGEDQIPPKLIKLSSEYLSKPLTDAINSSIRSSTFPDNGKRASVTPLDKGGPDKTIITNYRPISVLNTFSKFYENVIKNQLTSFINKRISVFISAYRKSYSTQHVLMRLLEEWRHKLDHDYIIGAVLMDLSKAFDSIPHDLINLINE